MQYARKMQRLSYRKLAAFWHRRSKRSDKRIRHFPVTSPLSVRAGHDKGTLAAKANQHWHKAAHVDPCSRSIHNKCYFKQSTQGSSQQRWQGRKQCYMITGKKVTVLLSTAVEDKLSDWGASKWGQYWPVWTLGRRFAWITCHGTRTLSLQQCLHSTATGPKALIEMHSMIA